ncbi:hypothetical protein ABIA25_000292 [Sinorhizobium fredii]|uniref:hypothetical protein n=1 Tax=Rhizobium fredii TaxID=380 RepID=UPI0035179069
MTKPLRCPYPYLPDEVILSVYHYPDGRQHKNPDEPQKWNATYLGQPLVTRRRVPSCDACRALLATGITGRVWFRHEGSPHRAFWLDIETAAGLTVHENDQGIRVAKYRPFSCAVSSKTSTEGSAGRVVAKGNKSTANRAVRQNRTGEKQEPVT